MGSRPGLQRWLEITILVADAQHRGADTVALLKSIGLLNLVTSTGLFRATLPLVKLALVDAPNPAVLDHWKVQINQVTHQQGIFTYRRAVDELRLWAGAITQYIAKDTLPLLAIRAQEYRALCQIYSRENALQSDKVALREVRHRVRQP